MNRPNRNSSRGNSGGLSNQSQSSHPSVSQRVHADHRTARQVSRPTQVQFYVTYAYTLYTILTLFFFFLKRAFIV